MSVYANRGKYDSMVRPYVFNWRTGAGGNLSKWAIARGRLVSEGYRPKLMCLGTSKMMGAGAGTTDGTAFTVGAALRTKTAYFTNILNARGIPASRESIFAANGLTTAAAFSAYDPRWTVTADWTVNNNGNNSIGGGTFGCSNPLTGTMTFAPNGTVDRVDVIYPRRTDRGSFTVSDGASVVLTINQATGSGGVLRATANLASGTGKQINFNRTNANSNGVDMIGAIAYNSAVPAIDVMNCGRFGVQTSGYTTNSFLWNSFNTLAYIAPDLTIIAMAANELANNSVPPSTFTSNMQTLITQAKLSGDVLLCVEVMGDTTGNAWGSASNQAAYIDAIYQLAIANDCPLINENGIASGLTATGGYPIANANGLMADGIHENARLNAILANTYADVLSM